MRRSRQVGGLRNRVPTRCAVARHTDILPPRCRVHTRNASRYRAAASSSGVWLSSCLPSVETRTQIAAFVLIELDISPIHSQDTGSPPRKHRRFQGAGIDILQFIARAHQRAAHPGPRADLRRRRRGPIRDALVLDRLGARRGAALTGHARQLLLRGVASLEGCNERLACVLDTLGGAIGGELRLDRCDLGRERFVAQDAGDPA